MKAATSTIALRPQSRADAVANAHTEKTDPTREIARNFLDTSHGIAAITFAIGLPHSFLQERKR
jgi:hypothetical protein